MDKEDLVVLVDLQGKPLLESGLPASMHKMEAHLKGLKHLAVSVFVINHQGQLLLQQRALHKYHSPGLWSNTCCTHPGLDETPLAAAHRRLWEEMGMKSALKEVFSFSYEAAVGQGLKENEFDHIFFGRSDSVPNPSPDEVMAFKWVDYMFVDKDIQNNRSQYTLWFTLLWPEVTRYIKSAGQSI
jgi:isopentenyl-diphosphate Delta-isomerase